MTLNKETKLDDCIFFSSDCKNALAEKKKKHVLVFLTVLTKNSSSFKKSHILSCQRKYLLEIWQVYLLKNLIRISNPPRGAG